MEPAPRRAAAIWKQFLPAQAKTTPVQAPRADAICERWIATARRAARACERPGCQFRDSRSRTIRVAAAGDPLTKPKNGPKSCVAEKPVMYRPSRLA